MATKSGKLEAPKDVYFDLVRQFPLRPIRNERHLKDAIAFLDTLTGRKRTREEEDYLFVLAELIERFEAKHFARPPKSDAKLVEALLVESEMTQVALAKAVGIAESTVSEIIAGKRRCNRRQIRKLCDYFKLSANAFES